MESFNLLSGYFSEDVLASPHFYILLLGLFDPRRLGPICCPETSARNYHSRLPKIPKECRFHTHIVSTSRQNPGIILNVTFSLRLTWKSRRPIEAVDWSAVTRSDLTVLLKFRAIPWLRRLVAGHSPYILGFPTKPVHMVFVVDRVAFGQVSLTFLQFSCVTVIPSLLRTSNSFPKHRRCTTSVIDSVII